MKKGAFIFLLFSVIVFVSFVLYSNRELNQIFKEYPKISLGDSIKNTVSSVYKIDEKIIRKSSNTVSIELKNKNKYTIVANNINENGQVLADLLTKGDFLLKNANSDTLYVFKNKFNVNEKKYTFKIFFKLAK